MLDWCILLRLSETACLSKQFTAGGQNIRYVSLTDQEGDCLRGSDGSRRLCMCTESVDRQHPLDLSGLLQVQVGSQHRGKKLKKQHKGLVCGLTTSFPHTHLHHRDHGKTEVNDLDMDKPSFSHLMPSTDHLSHLIADWKMHKYIYILHAGKSLISAF